MTHNATEPVSDALASMLSGCATCRFWAEQDEGPYHRDLQPERRDIVEDRDGVELQLGIRLAHSGNQPLTDATVEVWQCDALGRYSGFPPSVDSNVVSADTASRAAYLPDQTFLRGRQSTDGNGMVEFRTIYPGWYPGRTIHIHLMVHTDQRALTSQLYFPDDLSVQVLAQPPYSERPGRDTTNDGDEIYPTGGDPPILEVVRAADGYRAGICLVVPETRDAR
jgi:protocatechuate 3,4-dioxygenase beta subunit